MLAHLGSLPPYLLISGKLRPALPRDADPSLGNSGAALRIETRSVKPYSPICWPLGPSVLGKVRDVVYFFKYAFVYFLEREEAKEIETLM